jgi:cytoskeletal protein RodZ
MATQKDRITFRKVKAYAIISIVALLIVGVILLAVLAPSKPSTDITGTPSASIGTTPTAGPTASVDPTETVSPDVTETPTVAPTETPSSAPVNGMYEGGYCQLDANNVNFRTDSTTDSEAIRKIARGEVMIILNFNCGADGDWTKVKIGESIGYLKTEFLKKCTMNPEVEIANVTNSVNIRSEASASSSKVTELALGTKVTIIRFVNNDWVQIKMADDRTGFMKIQYLKEA